MGRWWLGLWCWVLVGLVGAPVWANPTIRATVTDEADVIDAQAEVALDKALRRIRKKTGVQMAVLTVDTTSGEPIEDYSLRVAQAWGGGSAERDDGVLFIMAIDDRRMRLEVGYGIEGVITDGEAMRIITSIRPALRAGDYAGGALSVVEQVGLEVAELQPGAPVPFKFEVTRWVSKVLGPWTFYGLGVVLVFFGMSSKRRWLRWLLSLVAAAPLMAMMALEGMDGVLWSGAGMLGGAALGFTMGFGERDPWRLALSWLVAVGAVIFMAFGLSPGGLFYGELEAWNLALTSTVFSFLTGVGINFQGNSGGGGRGGRSYSSGSSSGGGGSWSGGGGSFGGGGASSSW